MTVPRASLEGRLVGMGTAGTVSGASLLCWVGGQDKEEEEEEEEDGFWL